MPPRKKVHREGKEPMASSSQKLRPWKDAPIFFDTEEELRKFQDMESRTIAPIHYVTKAYLQERQCHLIMQAFERQGLYTLLGNPYNFLNDTLVRAFYANLKKDKSGKIFTKVNSRLIDLSEDYIHDLVGLSLNPYMLLRLSSGNFLGE